MSKVICDVCGTTYPETATQCPICGTAKNSASQTAAAATSQEAAGYSYVKGGRFSEKNVRRRNTGSRSNERRSDRRSKPAEEEKSNVGLIIIVIVLLIAIIAVVINLAARYLSSNSGGTPEDTGSTQASDQTDSTDATGDITPPEPETVPCTDFQHNGLSIKLESIGATYELVVQTIPENTTDTVTFVSSDPTIATVSDTGIITMVSQGEVDITVTCGTVTKICHVSCSTGEVDPQPPEGEFEFKFNTDFRDETTGVAEVTLQKAGETWKAYKNDLSVAPELITWISDDPTVCTVENGIVTAVGPGKTNLHVEYNGVSYTCLVRCSFAATGGDEDEPAPTGEYHTNKEAAQNDVSIAVGEPFTLLLLDSNNNSVTVTWTVDKSGYVSIDGNKITGLAATNGFVTVSTTYEGVTYSCKVRVK